MGLLILVLDDFKLIDTMCVIREMQSEIRGLQVENRRILDHLFGEENPE
jgi:hypothetical protein